MATSTALPDASTLASKRVIYVGGLTDGATIPMIRAAFIPFGNIKSVDMPLDYATGTHKGFCFVEYEDADDAEEAIYNLDGGELLGRTLKVSLAQANQVNKLSTNEAIWKSDEWFQKHLVGSDPAQQAEEQAKAADTKTLQLD